MTRFIDYIKKSFDILSAHSSDDTTKGSVYADTQSKDSHFSSESTQSGVTTYAAYEAETIGKMPGSVLPRDLNDNIIDRHTGPDGQPDAADD